MPKLDGDFSNAFIRSLSHALATSSLMLYCLREAHCSPDSNCSVVEVAAWSALIMRILNILCNVSNRRIQLLNRSEKVRPSWPNLYESSS